MADFGCHRVEVLLHLLGPVQRVTSVVANAALDREVEDTAVALLHFARGATAVVAVTNAAADREDTLDIFGTRGSIRAASLNSGTITVREDGEERIESHPPAANVHLPLVEDFLDAIRTARAPAVDGHVGRAVAEIQDAIYADTSPVR
jgi:predicted dehydrogenase